MTTLAESLGLSAEVPKDETPKPDDAIAELDRIEVDDILTVKDFFAKVLETKAYRRSVYLRLISGTLSPAVECKIYDHVIGKPVEKIEIEDTTKNVDGLSLEELHERQQRTMDAMQKILSAQTAVESRQH